MAVIGASEFAATQEVSRILTDPKAQAQPRSRDGGRTRASFSTLNPHPVPGAGKDEGAGGDHGFRVMFLFWRTGAWPFLPGRQDRR